MSAAQQVQMQMIHRLATIIAGVHDDPVAFAQLLVARDRAGRRHQRPQQPGIFSDALAVEAICRFGMISICVGRLRIDVRKTNAKLVFIDAACWNIPADDPAEEAVGRW